MQRWSGWLGAGVVTAGVSAAMFAGSGMAAADTGTAGGSDTGTSVRSAGADPSAGSTPSARDQKAEKAGTKSEKTDTDAADKKAEQAGKDAADNAAKAGQDERDKARKDADKKSEKAEQAADRAAASEKPAAVEKAEKAADTETAPVADTQTPGTATPAVEVIPESEINTAPEAEAVIEVESEVVSETEAGPEVAAEATAGPEAASKTAPETEVMPASNTETAKESALVPEAATDPGEAPVAAEAAEPGVEPVADADTPALATAAPLALAVAAPAEETRPAAAGETTTLRIQQQPVPITPQTGLPAVLTFVGNLVFGALTLLEQILVGPPALPPNSTVTVQTSTMKVGSHKVQADWYFPDTDTPPERLIWLQHGFLATGPMYSYTAATLAERTGAIVVAPTFVANFLANTGFWLGGDETFRSVANMFIGDREDLTASAVAAGYAERYGLEPTEATLPQKFGITGHSLGGSFTAGVTGYLAANGAADDLVGAIMLDGVPLGPVMPTAMGYLSGYEVETGRSVPLRHIAAPWNAWNSLSNANEWLNRERPDTFNGVTLTGGVHMDSMQGGNQVIQFLAYLFAGFPTAANQAAVQELAVAWFDEWFTGAEVEAPELGSTIAIPTPQGDAYGEVIGVPSVDSEYAESLVA